VILYHQTQHHKDTEEITKKGNSQIIRNHPRQRKEFVILTSNWLSVMNEWTNRCYIHVSLIKNTKTHHSNHL